jgi:hypothetical protein
MSLERAYRFFRAHAGGWVGHNAETAMHLARAEQWASDNGLKCTWEPEPEWEAYELGDAETKMPDEVWCAILRDSEGNVLDSLGMIGDPTDTYIRVVNAELASEAMRQAQAAERADMDAHTFQAL